MDSINAARLEIELAKLRLPRNRTCRLFVRAVGAVFYDGRFVQSLVRTSPAMIVLT